MSVITHGQNYLVIIALLVNKLGGRAQLTAEELVATEGILEEFESENGDLQLTVIPPVALPTSASHTSHTLN